MKSLSALLLVLSLGACSRKAPEVQWVIPDFTMTAVRAKGEAPFGRKDLLGRVWVADFVFTSCGGPCPLLSTRMAKLASTLPPQVSLLSVTVDPENDSAQVLRDYAKGYGADLERWVFLRGTTEQTYHLVFAGFRQAMSSDPRAEPAARVTHSTRFVLVDKAGGVRGFYDGLSDADDAALARDAKLLLEAGS